MKSFHLVNLVAAASVLVLGGQTEALAKGGLSMGSSTRGIGGGRGMIGGLGGGLARSGLGLFSGSSLPGAVGGGAPGGAAGAAGGMAGGPGAAGMGAGARPGMGAIGGLGGGFARPGMGSGFGGPGRAGGANPAMAPMPMARPLVVGGALQNVGATSLHPVFIGEKQIVSGGAPQLFSGIVVAESANAARQQPTMMATKRSPARQTSQARRTRARGDARNTVASRRALRGL